MSIVKAKCLKQYRNKDIEYLPNQVYELPEDAAFWLMDDAPGCFVILKDIVIEIEEKAVEKPPIDKMVKKPTRVK